MFKLELKKNARIFLVKVQQDLISKTHERIVYNTKCSIRHDTFTDIKASNFKIGNICYLIREEIYDKFNN